MKHARYWALAAASVLVVIFGSAQATGALWRDQETLGGGTIRSGTLDIKVGTSGAEVNDFLYQLPTILGATNIGPGGYSQAPLSVRNSGTVPMRYRLNSTSQTGSLNFTLTASKVTAVTNCPAIGVPSGTVEALYNGPFTGAQAPASPAFRQLGVGLAEVLCLRMTLLDSSTQSSSSQVKFSFLAQSR